MDLVQYSHGVLVAREDVSNVVAAPQPTYNPLPEHMPANPYAGDDVDPEDKTVKATHNESGDELASSANAVKNSATIPAGADPVDPLNEQQRDPIDPTQPADPDKIDPLSDAETHPENQQPAE